jgi:indole-3-glycerol phosphate synthase
MILEKVLAAKREEVTERKAREPMQEVEEAARAMPLAKPFTEAITRGKDGALRLIAEFKRASPSKGPIRLDMTPEQVAREYAAAGAAAMSVLTDKPFFSGSLDDLRAVRQAIELPILRKDFMIDPYQLFEARAAGADAILLIAAALTVDVMRELKEGASRLGMAAMVEVHDEAELGRALQVSPQIIGINNRDLRTFRVDFNTTLRLRPKIPAGIRVVSESGIQSRADTVRLQDAGVDAMLVGEALMRTGKPGEGVRELLGNKRTD